MIQIRENVSSNYCLLFNKMNKSLIWKFYHWYYYPGVFNLHFFWEQESTWCSFCLSFFIYSLYLKVKNFSLYGWCLNRDRFSNVVHTKKGCFDDLYPFDISSEALSEKIYYKNDHLENPWSDTWSALEEGLGMRW